MINDKEPRQALEDHDEDVSWMPDRILKREALIRSFAWVFGIMAGLSLTSILLMGLLTLRVPDLWAKLPNGHNILSLIAGHSVVRLLVCLLLFYALREVRVWTRWAVAIGLLLFVGELAYSIYLRGALAARLGDIPGVLPTSSIWLSAIEPVVTVIIACLVFLPPAQRIYDKAGLAYFRQDAVVRYQETMWITYAYAAWVVLKKLLPKILGA